MTRSTTPGAPVAIEAEAGAVEGSAVRPPHQPARWKGRLAAPLPAFLSVSLLVLAWWLLSSTSTLIASPWATFQTTADLIVSGDFFENMIQSLRRVAVGFVVAMTSAIITGILMGTTKFWERFFEPLVVLGLTIPSLVWALLAVMLFGIGEITAYSAVAVTIFPMLVVTIWAGVKDLDKELLDMAHVMKFSTMRKVRHVILPQLTPHIFGAIRYGLGLAWKIVVVVEMFGTSNGVGYEILQAYHIFNMRLVLAWTLAFVFVMLILERGLVGVAEKKLTAWRPKAVMWRR